MTDTPRLIEHAFPLKQTSLDSVHEKNVRHGHISTLHIWPARRPLAACRAALIATLLPDPGDPEKRRELCEKIAGKVVKKIERKKMPNGQIVERIKEETEGGILHWKRETENADTLDWFRQEIRKAYGGRAPKVLDPFAGGGAIPLEAMRLGCEATAVDINPVAWFILKCTLEYPQKLAGQTRPLPEFILHDDAFMAGFFKKAKGYGKADTTAAIKRLHERLKKKAKPRQEGEQCGLPFTPAEGVEGDELQADLAWHVRAWGQWVLDRARRELAQYYPTYADFEPIKKDSIAYEHQPMRLVEQASAPGSGVAGTEACPTLNAEFTKEYLENKRNPRWIAKPTVAYLWARTVTCKNCRATVPLLKTRWLCKKANKRVLLTMDVQEDVRLASEDRIQADVRLASENSMIQDVGQASVPANLASVPANDHPAPAYDPGHRRRLPHLRREGATYFITWRVNKLQSDLSPAERDLVVQAIKRFDSQRYDLLGWVVMNDHVHVIVHPTGSHTLSQITHSWKSFTANQLQKLHGREGAVWQDESWDRIIRHEKELFERLEYIRDNPGKRWPEYQTEPYPWVGFNHDEVKMAGTEAKMAGAEACPTKRVVFGVQADVPAQGGNAAQKREHDKRIGAGTMSRAGAKCPCCPAIMTMEDIRVEGKMGRLGSMMTVVVVDAPGGKDYRLPTEHELAIVGQASVPGSRVAGTEACPTITEETVAAAFKDVPFGVPDEPTPKGGGSGAGRAFSVQGYGLMLWRKLFTPRQIVALGTFVAATRRSRDEMAAEAYSPEWGEAVGAYLACVNSRTADYMASLCVWEKGAEEVKHIFMRWALPITWDFAEANPLVPIERFFVGGVNSAFRTLSNLNRQLDRGTEPPHIENRSAVLPGSTDFDLVFTDPPYYDAIPYSDLMDFFYIWLRRSLTGLAPTLDSGFASSLSPKWDHEKNDGELIDDSSRHELDGARSKAVYEDGMARVFTQCALALKTEGRLVIVFANKQPDAWETLVAAVIRSGFCVDGSWPIATEMPGGLRNLGRASLSSSVWLVAKKRPATARPGWDNNVLVEMRANIAIKLREFWDAGIRGPDFVWAATGPAMEAYSKHPVVRKANEPNATMGVGEFLTHVRRMVVDYVVGQVLSGERGADLSAADRLDDVTAYYLLHRHDFGMDDAPVGACILYATACGLSDGDLDKTWDLLIHVGSDAARAAEAEEQEDDAEARGEGDAEMEEDGGGSAGSKVKLKPWNHRRGKSMGLEAPEGKAVPLIDRIHRVMHLWKEGDLQKVDEYLDEYALRRNELFKRVVQALIELSSNSERSLLESISNHIGAKGVVVDRSPTLFGESE